MSVDSSMTHKQENNLKKQKQKKNFILHIWLFDEWKDGMVTGHLK